MLHDLGIITKVNPVICGSLIIRTNLFCVGIHGIWYPYYNNSMYA